MILSPLMTVLSALRFLLFACLGLQAGLAQERVDEPLVDVASACPGVFVELRYATTRNAAGRALYPRDARCLVRASVARRLREAHAIVAKAGYALKVWDGYRPPEAHLQLWKAMPKSEFVGDPGRGGSFHSWGIAVDVTLADKAGRDLPMPTDFDDFTPDARRNYRGFNPRVASNLRRLQKAMDAAGFMGMRDEWWHFLVTDWRGFGPIAPPPLFAGE